MIADLIAIIGSVDICAGRLRPINSGHRYIQAGLAHSLTPPPEQHGQTGQERGVWAGISLHHLLNLPAGT